MPAPESVLRLVERFERQRDALRSPAYNETSLRREFLDPLFRALGWDVDNSQGHAEQYKDVVHEDAIKIGTANKAPDYSFRIGGARKFFVEAKRPSVNIKSDPEPAYQLRRYAWSAKLALSVLTDFEELAVYDCRAKPAPGDKASAHRTLIFHYTEYATRWDELAAIFGRDSVLKGSFDQYAESKKGRRGTATVDAEFLKEIEGWRDTLARNLALRNDEISVRDLNFAVQRTIDRIIFLRIAEDRGLEEYGRLLALTNGANTYQRLSELFVQADARYNSGLFHFRKERERPETPDDLTLTLAVDDKVVKDILKSLYYPESPYEFSVISADILGQVYEQFLGKVIRLTAGHQAKVEEKPEVRKAGGVYYTPTYIVDYIVRETVGKLLEGKTPRQADKLRIVDPACGSGSFLIGAYQHLLDWYRDRYLEDGASKHRKQLFEGPGGAWRLTSAERKRILLNSIYGVDIDAQAVEVTKLSLLLKVLEGETAETIQHELAALRERALPDLGRNIKCGNSLIGPDFYDQQELGDLTEDERLRVNVFDWRAEFPEVFKGKVGGFDAVIGNPPYVLLQSLETPRAAKYFATHYVSARYKIDTYHLFMERGLHLAREGGLVGWITPSSYLRNKYAESLRRTILSSSNVMSLRIFTFPVFKGASVDTSVIICLRQQPELRHTVRVGRSEAPQSVTWSNASEAAWRSHPKCEFSAEGSTQEQELLANLTDSGQTLGNYCTAYFGIQTFDRKQFVHGARRRSSDKPVIDGVNIAAFCISGPTEFVDFRPAAIKSGGKQDVYEQERVVVRQIGSVPVAAIAPKGVYALNTIYNIVPLPGVRIDPRVVLGLLMSRLVKWYWRRTCFDEKRTFPKIKKAALLSIPVPASFPGDLQKADVWAHLIGLVEQLTAISAMAKRRREPLPFKGIQMEMDRIVYSLYDLTDAEIRVVEEATAEQA